MRSQLLTALLFLSLALSAQEGSRLGVYSMLSWNSAAFTGGDRIASAHFSNDVFGGPGLGLQWRRDLSRRWMVTSSFGFRIWGFQYTLRDEYSLARPDRERHRTVHNQFASAEVPVMLFYKGRLNCRSVRGIMGAGVVATFTGRQVERERIYEGEEQGTPPVMSSRSAARAGAAIGLRAAFGIERVMPSGRIAQLCLVFCKGFGRSGVSSVQYTADGQTYYHEFASKGGYVGLQSVFFFKSRAERLAKRDRLHAAAEVAH
jgi:hypothetical protein